MVAAASSPMIRWSVDGASVRRSAGAATSRITASARFSSTSNGSGATSTAVAVRCIAPPPTFCGASIRKRSSPGAPLPSGCTMPSAARNVVAPWAIGSPARGHAERRHLAEAADLELGRADDQHLRERRRLQIDGGLARAPVGVGGARDAVAHAGRHDDRDGHVALSVGAHRPEGLGPRCAPRPRRWRWCGTASASPRRAAGRSSRAGAGRRPRGRSR